MTLKKKIAKWLKITANDIAEIDGYAPKKFGESRSVEFEINGLVESFCKVTEWCNIIILQDVEEFFEKTWNYMGAEYYEK